MRILNVIDGDTKERLAAVADTSISDRRGARELDAVIACRGKPGLIVSDRGTEFTSNAMLVWAQSSRIDWHFIAPGKPMQNGVCGTFNGLILAVVGGLTALFGSLVMLTQPAVKTSLAWSTVAQMGFMIFECGLALFPLALLHILAHSLYKAHSFLASGVQR